MNQAKRHHYVPKAYLNAFCDQKGKLLIYRKDDPEKPLYTTPNATQFRSYYYSQPTLEGGQDNNTLEQLFSTVECEWPETVTQLHRRDDVNGRLKNIFEFMNLQRFRVPAARDLIEAMLAQTVKSTLKEMLSSGKLPPRPLGLEDLPNQVQISIDPHKSIHAMVAMTQSMGQLYSRLGFTAVHNKTTRPFLTSDNPVLWFDPMQSFNEQLPYTTIPNDGSVLFVFPVSPKLVLIGSTENKTYSQHGLLHSDVSDEAWVGLINEQVCRFAYEAVIAQSAGHEAVIAKYTDVSPVHESIELQTDRGIATIHRHVFGSRVAKPKWKKD